MTGGATVRESRLTKAGAHKRAQLLDAAEKLITTSGVDVSLRSIATEAGVAIGHLQHYFPSRAELIHAVLERALQRSLDRLAATVGGAPAPPEQVVSVVLAEHDDPLLVRLYVEVWASAARDEAIASVVREFYRSYTEHVAAYIRGCCPHLPESTLRAQAEAFVALMEGASLIRSGIAGTQSAATDAEITG
ncbi:MAG: TetR/AcrR family transcriptional regulator, partial [Rhodococcus sp.]|nr:TetR/AcrR family transcriptional regulator [Rhodococcus sp. (in: high G+C Gram-positive bacteria)]